MEIYESIFSDMVFTESMLELLKVCELGTPSEEEYEELGYSEDQLHEELKLFKDNGLILGDVSPHATYVRGLTKKGERVLQTLACVREIPEGF